MAKRKSSYSVGAIVSFVLVLLLVVGVVMAVLNFTGTIEKGYKSFTVSIDGTPIKEKATGYSATCDNGLSVDVSYAFPKFGKKHNEYTVKVIPSGKTDFEFLLEDEKLLFSDEPDLTVGFDVEYRDTGFTLTPKGSIRRILCEVYPDSKIVIDKDAYHKEAENFSLVVSSYNGKSVVVIDFAVPLDWAISSVELDKLEIVF